MRLNERYYSKSSRVYINSTMVLAAQRFLTGYAYGRSLDDAHIEAIVSDALDADLADGEAALAVAERSVFVVLTSADVTLTSGFCSEYCGWHAFAELRGARVRFAFVGDASRCPRAAACSALTAATAPNGDVAADAMASILVHELAEVMTDPDFDACVPSCADA